MSSCKGLKGVLTVWSAAVLGLAGCGVETLQCNAVSGTYQPLYTLVQGTCGPITMPNYVPVETGYMGAPKMTTHNFLNNSVTTEIIMRGCSMAVTQSVSQNGAVRSKLNGNEINIENENELAGMVTLIQFDEAGNAMCSGIYDARFKKDVSTVSAGTM